MRRALLTAVAALFIVMPNALHAQVNVGGQLNWADDFDFGIGGRVTLGLPVEQVPLEAVGSFDLFFPDVENVDYWEINAGVNWLIPVDNPLFTPYAGAGINVAHVSVDVGDIPGFDGSADDTEIGLNVQGGAKYEAGPVTPFAEVRFELSGGEQFVLTGGVTFNVGPGL